MATKKSSTLQTISCQICGKKLHSSEAISAHSIRSSIAEAMHKDKPNFTVDGFVCEDDLNIYRSQYVQNVLETETGDVSQLEKQVIRSMNRQEVLSKNVNKEFDSKLSFGARVADHVASFGGSWKFIIMFGCIIIVWIHHECNRTSYTRI